MFWELSLAESESTSSQLRLDKLILKMNDRRSSTDQKTNQKVEIAAGHDSCQLQPAVRKFVLKRYQLDGWTVSTSHIKSIVGSPLLINVFKCKIHHPKQHAPSSCKITTHGPYTWLRRKTWILRAAQDPDECWSLKRCANCFCEQNWLISQFHKFYFLLKIQYFIAMDQHLSTS